MSWLQRLYETYEQCSRNPQLASEARRLAPIGHTTQQAHVEIAIDDQGNFRRAGVIPKIETILPATEKSAGRSSGEAPHPLCEKVHYCAADYPQYGGRKPPYFTSYVEQLTRWCSSSFAHSKAKAVLAYVSKGTLIADLVREKVFHLNADGQLLTSWEAAAAEPAIFKQLTPKKESGVVVRDQGDALIRWRVEMPGYPVSATWEDQQLMDSWTQYYASQKKTDTRTVFGYRE